MITIRPFELTDKSAVIRVWHECGLVVAWNDPEKDIQRKLEVNPELFLVAFVDDTLVGTVMGGYEGHRGWINYMAVLPEHQGKGIGRQLIEQTELNLLALGCPKINLQVRSTNTQIIEYYKTLGFSEDHAVGMGKRLIPDN